MAISIKQLVEDSYNTAKDKGWHDPGMEKSVGDDIALMHSELSEALEEHRNGCSPHAVYFTLDGIECDTKFAELTPGVYAKPEGIPSELADVIIRIADFCGKHGIDLEAAIEMKLSYNKSRPHRHGGKRL